jgi:type VI protein secretion system component Hcp
MKTIRFAISLIAIVTLWTLPMLSQASDTLFYVELEGATQTFHWNRSAPHASCGEGYFFRFDTTGGSNLTGNRFTMKIKSAALLPELSQALSNNEKIDVTLYFQEHIMKGASTDHISFIVDDAVLVSIKPILDGSSTALELQFQADNYDWEP